MSATAVEILNKYLRALFDVAGDPIYLSFVGDGTLSTPPNPVKPADLELGAIANMIEWTRLLQLGLIKQLNLGTAVDPFLRQLAHATYGIPRVQGESDAQWVARVREYVLAPKISNGAIIKATRRFSSTEPQILGEERNGMFDDVSFDDVYTEFRNTTPGPEFDYYVFPAVEFDGGAKGPFFFILVLTDTLDSDIPLLFDYLKRWVAAGIDYEVQIQAT